MFRFGNDKVRFRANDGCAIARSTEANAKREYHCAAEYRLQRSAEEWILKRDGALSTRDAGPAQLCDGTGLCESRGSLAIASLTARATRA